MQVLCNTARERWTERLPRELSSSLQCFHLALLHNYPQQRPTALETKSFCLVIPAELRSSDFDITYLETASNVSYITLMNLLDTRSRREEN